MNWKDISIYSKDDKIKVPRTYEFRCAGFWIIVTRSLYHSPDAWILSCTPFVRNLEISTGTYEEAQAAAIEYMRKYFESAISILSGL